MCRKQKDLPPIIRRHILITQSPIISLDTSNFVNCDNKWLKRDGAEGLNSFFYNVLKIIFKGIWAETFFRVDYVMSKMSLRLW